MNGDGGLSDRDLFLSGGSAWFQGLGLVLVVIGVITWLWVALHGGRIPLDVAGRVLTIWHRGRAYRQQLRRAKHRQRRDSLAFRAPVR